MRLFFRELLIEFPLFDKCYTKGVSPMNVISLYKDGLSQKEISQKTGISLYRIRKELHQNNIETRNYRKRDSLLYEIVHKMLVKGYTYEEISKFLDIPTNSLSHYIHDNNLQNVGSALRRKERYAVITKLYNQGYSKTRIMEETSFGRKMVDNAINEMKGSD